MYDIIIIGGGPGGYHMAALGAAKGKKVAVIEGNKLGGTCLNVGCIPSKAFIHFSNVLTEANHALDNGLIGSELKVDHNYVVDYKDQKVAMLVKGTEAQVKGAGAEYISGWGKILPKENDNEYRVQVNDDILTCTDLVIATGSKVFVPDFIKGASTYYKKGDFDSPVMTSDEILSLRTIPENLVVIGAGVVGLELGTHFAAVGSKVTIIDVADKIGGPFDADICKSFQKAWTKRGVEFILESKVTEITETDVIYEDKEGNSITVPYDKVLMSVGRLPNTDNLGLENIEGLTIEKGNITTNAKGETGVPHVYAIGDVNGVSQLAHTAYIEGEVCLSNILGVEKEVNYYNIPRVIYARPEMAEIGYNEDEAKAAGLDHRVMKLSMMYSGRAVIENPAFVGEQIKLIIDNKDDTVLGLVIFGSYASELISIGSILVSKKFNIDEIKELVFAHPTVHEIVKDIVNH